MEQILGSCIINIVEFLTIAIDLLDVEGVLMAILRSRIYCISPWLPWDLKFDRNPFKAIITSTSVVPHTKIVVLSSTQQQQSTKPYSQVP
jgi:hypothetical protein